MTWLFALGWLLTGFGWWYSRGSLTQQSPPSDSAYNESERQLIRALESACKANDAKAARRAFDRWAEFRWPDMAHGVRFLQFDAYVRARIDELDRCLFSGVSSQSWDGAGLLQAARQMSAKSNGKAPDKLATGELAPLYPSS